MLRFVGYTCMAVSLLFLALAISQTGNFIKLLLQTSFYLPNMKHNNDLFDLEIAYLLAGQVHLKRYLPAMKINHHWRAGANIQPCLPEFTLV